MGRRVLAVLAAMLVGLVGVVAVLFYAGGADARAVANQRPQTVFVAKAVVPSGTTAADAVTKGLMAPTQIAAVGVPAGALTTAGATNRKLVALTDIAPGDFVIASRFGTAAKGQKAIQVPNGQVAISVSLSDPGKVGSFVTPGSRITIFDTYDKAAKKQTQVLLDDVLVIAVGSTSLTPVATVDGETAAAAPTSALVTVALPPNTAAKLVHAIQTGTLYVGLRGTGVKASPGDIVSDANLFSK